MEVSAPSSTDFIAQRHTRGRINTRSTRPSTAGTHSSHSTSPSIASSFSIMAPQAGSSTLHVISTSPNPGSSSHNMVLPVSSHAAYWQNGARVFWRAILLSAQFAARKLLIFNFFMTFDNITAYNLAYQAHQYFITSGLTPEPG